jgi:hypothetical protein
MKKFDRALAIVMTFVVTLGLTIGVIGQDTDTADAKCKKSIKEVYVLDVDREIESVMHMFSDCTVCVTTIWPGAGALSTDCAE